MMCRRMAGVFAAVIMMFALVGCGATTVSMQDYITVKCSGLNTIARANVNFDEDAFLKATIGEVPADEAEHYSYMQKGIRLLAAVNCEVEPSSDLKNGDTLTVLVTYDEDVMKELKVDVQDTVWEYTVEGLEEGVKADLFADMVLKFEGIDGKGRVADAYNASEDQFLTYVTYQVEPRANLSNGDKVVVTASCNETYAHEYGYLLGEKELEVEVSGLGVYLTKTEDLTAEAVQNCWDLARKEMSSIGANTMPEAAYLLLYTGPREEKSILDWESIFVMAYQPENGFEPYESVIYTDLTIDEDSKELIRYSLYDSEKRYKLMGARCGGDTLKELKSEVEEEYMTYCDGYTLYEIDCSGMK